MNLIFEGLYRVSKARADTHVNGFGLFFAGAPVSSLQNESALFQTQVLFFGHSGTAPPLLKADLLLGASCALRQHCF